MLRIASFEETPALPTTSWPRSSITALAAAFAALGEGLATSRRYQRLRSNGISHDTAIRDAVGIGSAGSRPIHFAGRM